MSIYTSMQWRSDLDRAISNCPDLNALAGKRVLITGCTGLICSTVMDLLIHWNEIHEKKIHLLAAGRSFPKIKERFGPSCECSWFEFVHFDAACFVEMKDVVCDYIIHGASNASPKMIVQEPVETILSNVIGLYSLLELAKKNKTTSVLFISSSEVYGKKEGNLPFREDEYGYVDLLNFRNSYAMGKRAAETLCVSYSAEHGIKTVIVRPGHIYGPTASNRDSRVSSAWAYAAARGEDIVMKSDGGQLRSYCYCIDCATAILFALLKGENLHAYNISNPDSIISIKEMTIILAKAAGVDVHMQIASDDEKKAFNPMSNSSLDSASLLSLGWKGQFSAEEGFSHTVEILKEVISTA